MTEYPLGERSNRRFIFMRKSEKLFCHYLFKEYNTILLGFPKKCRGRYGRKRRGNYDRTAFYNAMERWNTRELEKIKFVGKYRMILADFIYCTFGLSLNDIAGELLEVTEYKCA